MFENFVLFLNKNIININKIYLTIIVFLNAIAAYSQNYCGLSEELSQEISLTTPTALNLCFDISEVQENCIPVYINVNVHFFLNSNCTGNIATAPNVQGNLHASNAFSIADDLINNANYFLEHVSANGSGQWHAAFHGATVTDQECIPIRYVLNGVYIHCDSNAQNTFVSFTKFNSYFVDGSSVANIFISNILPIGNSNPSGFASRSRKSTVVENFGTGVFNHEFGHIFNLAHTFETGSLGDDCDDTWYYGWEWDANCDGIEDLNGKTCWSNSYTFNDEDACDNSLFCNTHPCCEWTAQDNNVMTYSAWGSNHEYAAFTPCQINRMLTDISDDMCDYVEGIGNECPPPKAFIGTIPIQGGGMKCPVCFYMNASFNETKYEMKIVNQLGVSIVETGEIPEKAGKYCIYPENFMQVHTSWPSGFITGQMYTVKLKVYNECGDFDEDEFSFILPPPCSGITAPAIGEHVRLEIKTISPNPFQNVINIQYDIHDTGTFNIYGVHNLSAYNYGLLHSSSAQVQANQTLQMDLTNFVSGTNSLIFQLGDEIHVKNIIKQ